MATITSEIQLFNLAVQEFGNYPDIESISSPEIDAERIFAQSWTICRQMALKTLKPNFAIERANISATVATPAHGYSYQYLIPSDCLAVLGIGDIEDVANNSDYAIEGLYIRTDLYTTSSGADALPIRYIKDISDVSFWTPEFCSAVALYLAVKTCMAITKDSSKLAFLEEKLRRSKIECCASNSMENKPIIVRKSNFSSARTSWKPRTGYKK